MSALTTILNALSTEVSPKIISVLEEAHETRSKVKSGVVSDSPMDLHDQLLHNRQQIERLEFLTSELVLLKSRTVQEVQNRKGLYDDAYTAAATKPSIGFADFASAKEKDAHFALGAMDEQINLRKAEKLHRDVDSAWDYTRILLRGAEGVQRDLELRIRLISLTSSLEK